MTRVLPRFRRFSLGVTIAVVGLATSIDLDAQEAVTEQKLLGSWLVSGSPFQETLTFKGNNELLITTTQSKRDGRPIAPIIHSSEAVYRFGTSACTVGQESGNLFFAKQAERCCLKIYQVGQTLIFDQIRSGSSIAMGLSLCQSKTLRRPPK